MFVEDDSYREVVIRIDHSEFLQHFVRLGVKPTMDFTFLNKAFCMLSPSTLEAMHQVLCRYILSRAAPGRMVMSSLLTASSEMND